MRSKTTVAALAVLCCAAQPSHANVGGDVEKVLARARGAVARTSWSELEAGVALSGTATLAGVESGFELYFTGEGHYRFATDGPIARTSTWDGAVAWSLDRGGPSRVLTHAERDEQRIPQWVHSGYWLDQGAPLEIAQVEADAERVVLELSSTESPAGGHVTLDRATWRPLEFRRDSEAGDTVVAFSDYREVAGIPLAHRVVVTQAGVEGTVVIERSGAAPADPGDRYALGSRAPTDTRFDADAPAQVAIRRVQSGHLMVHPTVDGEDRGWFILDSGAGQSCIDPTVADALGLPEFGTIPAVGVGGTVEASFRQGERFALGPIEITDPVFVELDLAFLEPHFGVPVAGICGYDLFARSVVELDLEGPELAIFDPATYELERGEWSELTLDDRLPCIRCSFEGDRSGLFKIDTGDAGTVAFYAPAVEELGLLDGREVRASAVGGVGGMQAASVGELGWFEIGGRRFEPVEATFVQTDSGAFSDASVLGSLGGQLLAPFRIVFDYPGERIALVPRSE